jgi:D-alanine-D-alanine ligase
VVVKPPLQGSTIGIHRVFDEAAWPAAVEEALGYDGEVLVERFIPGAELTVAIVCDEVLPVVQIEAPDGYYNYQAKYTKGQSTYRVPAPLPEDVSGACQAWAQRAYAVLGCRGMGRVDLRLTPEHEPFVLELNTIPGFTETSLLPMAARSAGLEFSRLCDRILRAACL